MRARCDEDQEPASGSTAPEHQVRALSLATPGVEGRAEQDILDLLRSDLVPAWYGMRMVFSGH
jgi:hypothetical protein